MEITYKYVHILWHNELKFNIATTEMIHSLKYGFNPEEHLFVTPHQQVYDAICGFGHAKLETGNLINQYGDQCEWLVSHDLPQRHLLGAKWKYLHKIVWRTWGGTFFFESRSGQPIKNLAKKVANLWMLMKIRQFRGIGIANGIGQLVDEIDVRQNYGNIQTIPLNYAIEKNVNAINAYLGGLSPEKNDTVHVLIGHSGWDDYFIRIIDQLEKFKNENVKFHFSLSYGAPEYIAQVKEYARSKLNEKAVFQEQFVPYSQYIENLNGMDIAILDNKTSSALSNTSILLCLQKKLFLNREGILHKAFLKSEIPHCCTDEIESMSFSEFCAKIDYNQENLRALIGPFDMEYYVEQWKQGLQWVDQR